MGLLAVIDPDRNRGELFVDQSSARGPARFAGRSILITGAASGIGRACALRLAGEGADIVALDLDEAGLASLRAEIDAGGTRCENVVGSVAELKTVDAAIARTMGRFGRLDGLINNAGIGGPMVRFDRVAPEDFDRMVAVNLRSAWYGIKAAREPMLAGGGGAILNVASMAGIVPNRHHSLYGMTKAAVISLTHHAAMDYALDGIRVNCLCPGPVETPIFEQMRQNLGDEAYEGARRQLMRRTLLGRFGHADEQAAAAAFLLSGDAAFITGIAMPVDGGWAISDGQTAPRPSSASPER
jgi:NAD(P)-dependent dehydrogenase (short-subunit alcohol dehydrogenase family)